MEEEKDKFEDLEKMEDSDWSEFFEEKEENWYEPNIFEDEVVENICANVKYIAVEGYECVEILQKKPCKDRSELLYCYQLGEDYAMANPHAISAVWYSTEDIEVKFYDEMCRSYIYSSFDYARLLFQPFFPIALGRVTWNIVDVIVGVFLVVLIFKDYKK